MVSWGLKNTCSYECNDIGKGNSTCDTFKLKNHILMRQFFSYNSKYGNSKIVDLTLYITKTLSSIECYPGVGN